LSISLPSLLLLPLLLLLLSPQLLLPLSVLLFVIPTEAEGSAVSLLLPSSNTKKTHVISTGGGAFAAEAERPLYFALTAILRKLSSLVKPQPKLNHLLTTTYTLRKSYPSPAILDKVEGEG
jgi:hypothetical protein